MACRLKRASPRPLLLSSTPAASSAPSTDCQGPSQSSGTERRAARSQAVNWARASGAHLTSTCSSSWRARRRAAPPRALSAPPAGMAKRAARPWRASGHAPLPRGAPINATHTARSWEAPARARAPAFRRKAHGARRRRRATPASAAAGANAAALPALPGSTTIRCLPRAPTAPVHAATANTLPHMASPPPGTSSHRRTAIRERDHSEYGTPAGGLQTLRGAPRSRHSRATAPPNGSTDALNSSAAPQPPPHCCTACQPSALWCNHTWTDHALHSTQRAAHHRRTATHWASGRGDAEAGRHKHGSTNCYAQAGRRWITSCSRHAAARGRVAAQRVRLARHAPFAAQTSGTRAAALGGPGGLPRAWQDQPPE